MELFYFLLFAIVAARPQLIDRTKIKFESLEANESASESASPSNADDPKLSTIQLLRTSTYLLIDSTPCGKTIIALLFNEDSRIKKTSYVVVSNDTGISFKEYSTDDFDDMFKIDYFKIDYKFIFLYSYSKSKVYMFDHSFNLILKTQPQTVINEFYVHPILITLQANLGVDKTLYISVNGGKSWENRGSDVENFTWIYDNTGNYVNIIKTKTSDLFIQNAVNKQISYMLQQDTLKIIQNGNQTYIIYKDNGKYKVGFINSFSSIRKLYIPTKLDIIDFSVSHTFKEEYMVLATLSDSSTTLYQGNLKTYRFVRVLEKVKSLSNSDYGRCYDIAYFERIPGFILANTYGFEGFSDASTLISFNHGVKWQRVKVGIFEDGKPATECHLPSCSFTLHFDCTVQSNTKHYFIQSELAPYILTSQGYYKISGTTYSGLFISSDAGYTWHLSMKGTYFPAMINEGGVLFGVPRITKNVYYSMNEGKNWSSLTSDYGQYIIEEIGETNLSRTKLRLIGYSFYAWYVYTIDFTTILNRECLKDDYTIFRPSSSSTTHCFMGRQYAIYRKKIDSICRNTLEKMPPAYTGYCQCSQDDFACNYGHKMLNGLCIEDSEAEVVYDPSKWCTAGSWISTPSAYASIAYDTCDKSYYNIGYKVLICGVTKYDQFVAFIHGVRLGFFILKENIFKQIALPATFSFPELAGTYTIDVFSGCIYYLTQSNVVRRSCWGNSNMDFKLSDEIYISEQGITYLDFDQIGYNLVYIAGSELNIKNVRSGRTKVVSNSYTTDISFLRVVSDEGFLLMGQHKSNTMNKLFFNGSLIESYTFTDTLLLGAYDNMNKKIYGLTNKGLYVIVGRNVLLTKITVPKNTNDFQFFNGSPVFGNSTGVFYMDKIYELKSFRGMYVKNSTSYTNNVCDTLACGDICYPISNKEAECACPNDMKLIGSVCKCEESKPDCLKCKDNEFTCEEAECISNLKRCDGYVDCRNGADEFDCKIECRSDQFACTSEVKCITLASVCDGIIDCVGSEDEIGCKYVTNCTADEFACNNKVCIPAKKKCDKINDCGDNSDEDTCPGQECSSQEFKCNDGICIPLALVCDNNLDCSNWEDESGCHVIHNYNATCFYKCSDDKCITKDQVCNRVADCSDGFDELICGYETECLPGSIACDYSRECYTEAEKCDGKYDCSDYTDENHCESKEMKCTPGFTFQCTKSKECIPIGYYCDYWKDCEDGSDELEGCLNKPKVTYVYTRNNGTNNKKVLWITRNEVVNASYEVSLYLSKDSPAIYTKVVSTKFLLLTDLKLCVTYLIKVRINIVGAQNTEATTYSRLYPTSLPSVEKATYISNLVSWTPVGLFCVSRIYEVECKNGNDIKFKNFTKSPVLSVPSFGSCYVRVCPFKAVGPFCSDLVEAIGNSSAGVNAAIVICTLILIAVVIVALYFVYRRYHGRISSAYSKVGNYKTQAREQYHESVVSDDEIDI